MKSTTVTEQNNRSQRYTGSFYQDNYVWGAAMNLCWNELCQTILGAPLQLATDAPEALDMADKFNQPVCTAADLDAASYYVKAGFGPKTIEAINRECRARFPEKTMADLNLELQEQDLVSYAYFLKKVAYETPFTLANALFEGKVVAGFEARDREQKRVVEVLDYQNDQQFILRIRLKDPADTLLLAKGYDTLEPAHVLQALAGLRAYAGAALGSDDYFKMPLLRLKFRRDYPELLGKRLGNEGFREYIINQMFEQIAFELDEAGARVENEAVIGALRSAMPDMRRKRYFYLDKPFWVIMKRSDSENPYFMLGVRNVGGMETK